MKEYSSIKEYFNDFNFSLLPKCVVEELPTDNYTFKGELSIVPNEPNVTLSMGYAEDQVEEYTNIFFLSIDDAKQFQKELGRLIRNWYYHMRVIEDIKKFIRETKNDLEKNIIKQIIINPVDMCMKVDHPYFGYMLIRIEVLYEMGHTVSYTILSERSYITDDGDFFNRLQDTLQETYLSCGFHCDEIQKFKKYYLYNTVKAAKDAGKTPVTSPIQVKI